MKTKNNIILLTALIWVVISLNTAKAAWERDLSFPQQDVTDVEIIYGELFFTSFNTVYKKTGHLNEPISVGALADSVGFRKLFFSNSRLLAGTWLDGIYESIDSGKTWITKNTGLTGSVSYSISCFTARGDSVYIGTSGASVFVSSLNNQINWQPYRNGLLWNVAWDTYSIYNWNGILFSGSGQNGYIHRNLLNTNIWENIQFNENIGTGLAVLAIGEIDSSTIVAIGMKGIYNSIDSGSTWTIFPTPFEGAISGKVININTRTLAIISHLSKGLYIYEWKNNNWVLIDNQQGIAVYDVEYFDGHLYAACWDGLWYYPLNSTDIEPPKENVPNKSYLSKNYPNPFNPKTTIEFEIPVRSRIILKVYNINGQLIDKLIDNVMSAGKHTIEWDGSNYASGIYYYKIETNEYNLSRKMLLLK